MQNHANKGENGKVMNVFVSLLSKIRNSIKVPLILTIKSYFGRTLAKLLSHTLEDEPFNFRIQCLNIIQSSFSSSLFSAIYALLIKGFHTLVFIHLIY